FADHFRAANLGAGLELVAQGLADIGHVIEIVDTEVMDPLHDLPGTKALLPELFEKSFQFRLCQAQQVDLAGGLSHCNPSLSWCLGQGSAGALAQLGFGEEVADFTGSGGSGVRAVNSVGIDGLGEVGTDGTGSSFLGVGR